MCSGKHASQLSEQEGAIDQEGVFLEVGLGLAGQKQCLSCIRGRISCSELEDRGVISSPARIS